MAAVVTAPSSTAPARSIRPGHRPTLRVLEGGRRPGEPIARSPRISGVSPGLVRERPQARPSTAVYRRRRLAAVALVVVALVTVWLALVGARVVLAGSDSSMGGDGVPAVAGGATAGPVHVVQPGDTLWSIAEDLEPRGDVRALVDDLSERAGGAPLQPGQRIPLDGLLP